MTKDNLKLFTLAAGLLLAAACKKSEPQTAPRAPETDAVLPMPPSSPAAKDAAMDRALDERYANNPERKEAARTEMAALDANLSAEDSLAAINQRTMVVPAPADFRPEAVARKIRLKLVLEKSNIRVGENPRFRLELTNVGREPIDYQEYESSIFKGGSIGNSMRTIKFHLTDRRGKRMPLLPSLASGRAEPIRQYGSGPEWGKEMLKDNALSQASTSFKVKLLPGETLRSLGDGDSAKEPFRTLRIEEGFKKPGAYQLQVELDDRPKPLNAIYIKFALRYKTMAAIKKDQAQRMKDALGPVSSDAALEITQ